VIARWPPTRPRACATRRAKVPSSSWRRNSPTSMDRRCSRSPARGCGRPEAPSRPSDSQRVERALRKTSEDASTATAPITPSHAAHPSVAASAPGDVTVLTSSAAPTHGARPQPMRRRRVVVGGPVHHGKEGEHGEGDGDEPQDPGVDGAQRWPATGRADDRHRRGGSGQHRYGGAPAREGRADEENDAPRSSNPPPKWYQARNDITRTRTAPRPPTRSQRPVSSSLSTELTPWLCPGAGLAGSLRMVQGRCTSGPAGSAHRLSVGRYRRGHTGCLPWATSSGAVSVQRSSGNRRGRPRSVAAPTPPRTQRGPRRSGGIAGRVPASTG